MANQRILATEEMVGYGHGTKADTLNRLTMVDHNEDGTHEKLTLGSDADGDMYYRASSVLARLAKGAANLKMFMNAGETAPEWAAGFGLTSFTRIMSAVSGNVAYTGAGFKPSAVIAISVISSAKNFGIGFALNTSEFSIRYLIDGSFEANPSYLVIHAESVGNSQESTVVSMDSDGMTLAWSRVGAPTATITGYILWLR